MSARPDHPASSRRFTLAQQLLGMLGASALGMIIVGGVGLYSVQDLANTAERQEVLSQGALWVRDAKVQESTMKSAYYLVAADAAKGTLRADSPSLKGLEQAQTDMITQLDSLDVSGYNDATREGIADLKTQGAAMVDLNRQAGAALMRGDAEGQEQVARLMEQAVGTAQTYHEQLDALADSSASYVTEGAQRQDDVRKQAPVWIGVALLAVLAALTFFARRFIRRLVRTVSEIRATLDALAKGDLTVPVEVHTNDELGDIAQSTQTAQRAMRDLITELQSTSQSVSGVSEHMAAASSSSNAASRTTVARLGEVNSSTETISQGVNTVAAGTEEMSASIQEIAKNATDAARVAAEAVAAAEHTTRTVAKLGESSAEIGAVIKTITSIAEQTNLLALNATIEAARAGEAGKGFAVVAAEVKDLAQETSKATEDISQRVEAIQADTEGAVAAIDGIAAIVARINDTQATIASAVEEQTATTDEMGRHVNDVARSAGQVSAAVTAALRASEGSDAAAAEVAQASTSLGRRATALTGIVDRYRL